MTKLEGDWRSAAYGADRRVHFFDYVGFTASRKSPICGIRDSGKYAKRDADRKDACRECLYRLERDA
jgi:hypothetical protein